ncbi:portal protein [Exiguobacterium phage vB_EalM-132]|nr:portal protein [Exiguobacterium phage vB_EalM-132]
MEISKIFTDFVTDKSATDTHQFSTKGAEEETLEKSERVQAPQSIVEDPLALINAMGFKDKPARVTYDTLRKMANRNSVISAVIQTRVNQVSTFTQPARYTKDGVGFEIKLRDPKKKPTDDQKATMLAIEAFIENCGYSYNPHRDDFDTFVRKVVRDSLTYDQLTFEVVPDRMGRPAEIYAVDASTVRAAKIESDNVEGYITPDNYFNNADNEIKWVQVVDNKIISEFTGNELAFAIRNPRTDINIHPYGFSELEILIHQVTAHLWAEEYNSRFFSQGGTTKGILNLKGQNVSKPQLDAFRRQWTAQLAGMTGAWKTPVVSVEGLEYINVSQSNREMEYEMWLNYLINIVCAVYQIDPAEINFPNRGGAGGSGGGLGEGGIEDRLKSSKDKGLRPLLRFVESVVNRHIIRRFSSEYTFNFVGLNGESEQERMEKANKAVRSFKTINEVRAANDEPPLENGDIILDPTYINYVLQKEQMEQAQQAMPEGEDGAEDEEDVPEEQTPEEEQEQQQDENISQSIDDKY